MPALVSRTQALQRLLNAIVPRPPAEAAPALAIGHVAAQDIAAGCDVPETACSVRDGYALRTVDASRASGPHPVRLEVKQCIRAESLSPTPVGQGEAARVLTGGTIPPGADCVLAEEDIAVEGGQILVSGPVQHGWFVRPEGGEIGQGVVITRAGREITPQAAAVMTRTRLEQIPIHPAPTARILALGSELALPGHADASHFPADNLVLTSGLLERAGALVTTASVLPDERSRLVETLSQPDLPDLVITTGGTGKSERDYARTGAMQSGFDILFDTVDMRPGRNVFAARRGSTLLFGLPGPPAAVFTCFHALILPVVRRLRGLPDPTAPLMARSASSLKVRPGSEWLVQCELEMTGAHLTAIPLTGQDAPPMLGMARADGLAVIQGDTTLLVGDELEILTTGLF